MIIRVTINQTLQEWEVEANEPFLDTLRRNGLTGAKRVCDSGECGACAVIVNDLAVDSCILLAPQVDGATVTTVEGLEVGGRLHLVQEEFARNGSIQCGFCIPGMAVTAANYLSENPHPSEEQIRHVFIGNLCRCTGYKKPVEAVLAAAVRGGRDGQD